MGFVGCWKPVCKEVLGECNELRDVDGINGLAVPPAELASIVVSVRSDIGARDAVI